MSADAVADPFTLLCRIYEKAARPVSNSYGLESRFAGAKSNKTELPMSAISIGSQSKPARRRFWHELAERLDALVAYPTKHAVSELELRRVDEDIKRCRQLMFQKPQQKRV
jgi:hypothetical protein